MLKSELINENCSDLLDSVDSKTLILESKEELKNLILLKHEIPVLPNINVMSIKKEILHIESKMFENETNYSKNSCNFEKLKTSDIVKKITNIKFKDGIAIDLSFEFLSEIQNFIINLDNGNYFRYLETENKLKNQHQSLTQTLNNYDVQKNHVDDLIFKNEEIFKNNQKLYKFLDILKKREIQTLQNRNQVILSRIHIFDSKNAIKYLTHLKISKSLNKILKLRKSKELNSEILNSEIQKELLNSEIQNLDFFNDCGELLKKLKNDKVCMENNLLYTEKIKDLNVLLKYLRINGLVQYISDNIKALEIQKANELLNSRAQKLTLEIQKFQNKLNDLRNSFKECQNSEILLRSRIEILSLKIDQYTENTKLIVSINEEIAELENKITIYNEYLRLFNNKELPFKLMSIKLTTFDNVVNSIFQKYTNYVFSHDQSETGKLLFVIKNKKNKCYLDIDRLSGYESINLQLALNQAVLSISSIQRCGFIVIDESFDCIDQSKFIDQLPSIVDNIRQYYQNIILISHRDVPPNVIDKQIKIKYYGTYSVLE